MLPHGVWIDRHGRVLVCDRENDRVQVFDQDGKLLRIWPTALVGPAVFYVDAEDIVGDSRGDLYVVRPGTSARTRRIVKHVRVG